MGLTEPFVQVRLHRNIAASSLAADCNIPQRPPADTGDNPMKFYFYTEGTHLLRFSRSICSDETLNRAKQREEEKGREKVGPNNSRRW